MVLAVFTVFDNNDMNFSTKIPLSDINISSIYGKTYLFHVIVRYSPVKCQMCPLKEGKMSDVSEIGLFRTHLTFCRV